MIDLLFILFLIVFLIYHYIWTGSCGMACRGSGYSRFSGMSGLNMTTSHTDTSAATTNCVCDACPCAFFESVIRRCQPATGACEEQIEVIKGYMAGLLTVVSDLTWPNTIENEATKQRQAQLIDKKETLASDHNFTFDPESWATKRRLSVKISRTEVSPDKRKTENNSKMIEYAKKMRSDLKIKDVKIKDDNAETSKAEEKSASTRNVPPESLSTPSPPVLPSTSSSPPSKPSSNKGQTTSSSIPADELAHEFCVRCENKGHDCIDRCPKSRK